MKCWYRRHCVKLTDSHQKRAARNSWLVRFCLFVFHRCGVSFFNFTMNSIESIDEPFRSTLRPKLMRECTQIVSSRYQIPTAQTSSHVNESNRFVVFCLYCAVFIEVKSYLFEARKQSIASNQLRNGLNGLNL